MSLRTIKRRRREFKTDYLARVKLLTSGRDRVVVRKTNRYIILQLVKSEEAQDKVILVTTSRELLNYGWNENLSGSLKSISASYLTGILMAKKMKKGNPILDMGLAKNHKGGRIYASVKGLIDGGIDIPASEEILPLENRIEGEHLKEGVKKEINKIKENILKNGK